MKSAHHVMVRDVEVEFEPVSGEVVRALDGVSLDVDHNEFLSIVGPSGCGKSTLLKAIAGMVTPSAGSIEVVPVSNAALPTAMVWQEAALVPWRTILDNVCLPLEIRGVRRGERRALGAEYLAKVGLEKFAKVFPHQVSGGMRQRAGIARALVADAGVLLMDEPFGSVDAQTRLVLQDDILELWERDRKTVLFVTHSIEEALLLGDRVVVMSARPGQIKRMVHVAFGRPRERGVERGAEFQALVAEIWDLLRQEARQAELQP